MTYKAWNTGIAETERPTMGEAIQDAVNASVFWTDSLPQCGYIEVATIVRIPNSEIAEAMVEQARKDVTERNANVKATLLEWINRMDGTTE